MPLNDILSSLSESARENQNHCILSGSNGLRLLKDDEAPLFREALKKNPHWQCVHLDDFNASDSSLTILAGLINECPIIDLSFTGLTVGNKTIKAFALALKNNKTLKKLNIGGTLVTEENLLSLADAIKNHPALEQFCVVYSAATNDKKLVEFAMLIAQNTKLLSRNINGFVFCDSPINTSAKMFIDQLLSAVIKRNIDLKDKTMQEQHNLYNEFAIKWNREVNKKCKEFGFDKINIRPADLLIPLKGLASLYEMVRFFSLKHIDDPRIVKHLHELPERIKEDLNIGQDQSNIREPSRLSYCRIS